jgi:hypothetical protein
MVSSAKLRVQICIRCHYPHRSAGVNSYVVDKVAHLRLAYVLSPALYYVVNGLLVWHGTIDALACTSTLVFINHRASVEMPLAQVGICDSYQHAISLLISFLRFYFFRSRCSQKGQEELHHPPSQSCLLWSEGVFHGKVLEEDQG